MGASLLVGEALAEQIRGTIEEGRPHALDAGREDVVVGDQLRQLIAGPLPKQ